MTEAILDGVRVVDLSGAVATVPGTAGLAGAVATLVLAEAGADVVVVEPPGGSPVRALPGFRTWHRSKRSVELDLDDPDGRAALSGLLAGADVLVHGLAPDAARSVGLDDRSLAAPHPDLVVSSVLGWPVRHPDAGAPVDDLLTLARLGVLHEQQGVGDDPIYVRFPLGSWGAAWLAAIGITARLVARGRTGRAGPAHTSLAQGALVPMMMHWHRAERPSDMLRIGMPKHDTRATLFECGDGVWIHAMAPTPDTTPLMQEVLAELGEEAVRAANERDRPIPGFPNLGANREAFLRRPATAWLEELWAHDIPAQVAAPLGAILTDEQAVANRYAIDLDDPEEGRITVAGLPLTIDPPAAVVGPAPALGAHTDEVRAEWAQPRADRARPTADPGRWPLEGVKVLDLGNFLAGPLGPMLLADLGADVVKLEAATGDPMRWADWPFVGCQRGKRGVALNLKDPAARPALEALLRWADVVHHNLRMPAARRLGLDAAAVRAVNPDVVFCHTSSYGPAGPRADWPGYDQLFQASCGWEVAGAGEGNPPMWHRFGFTDHLCAMSSVVATLLALYERDRTGRGTDVAGSLLGAAALTNSETFLRADGTLAPVPVLDRTRTTLGPGRRILQGTDGWFAVAADRPDEVERLCAALGAAGPAELPAAAGRAPVEPQLAALAAAGVPAVAVRLDQKDPFFDDPDHLAAGLVARYPHGDWGVLEQPGALWDLGDLGVRLELAPPLLGEHTREVLREAGLTADEVDALVAAGVAVAR